MLTALATLRRRREAWAVSVRHHARKRLVDEPVAEGLADVLSLPQRRDTCSDFSAAPW
jgi:hypothetical protein